MEKYPKLPFDCTVMDKEPVEVANPYSGEKATLTPQAVAVYDTIKGAEMTGDYDLVRNGIDWFIKHYTKEYGVLLD